MVLTSPAERQTERANTSSPLRRTVLPAACNDSIQSQCQLRLFLMLLTPQPEAANTVDYKVVHPLPLLAKRKEKKENKGRGVQEVSVFIKHLA